MDPISKVTTQLSRFVFPAAPAEASPSYRLLFRTRNALARILLLSIVCASLSPAVHAQSTTPNSETVQILSSAIRVTTVPAAELAQGIPAGAPPGTVLGIYRGELKIKARNAANQPIVAYVLRAEFVDDRSGKTVEQASVVKVMGLSVLPGPADAIGPGEPFTESMPSPVRPDGTPPHYRLVVDYLVFADGTSSGPDLAGKSATINATRYGWQRALTELRQMLQQRGPQAVVDALNGPLHELGRL